MTLGVRPWKLSKMSSNFDPNLSKWCGWCGMSKNAIIFRAFSRGFRAKSSNLMALQENVWRHDSGLLDIYITHLSFFGYFCCSLIIEWWSLSIVSQSICTDMQSSGCFWHQGKLCLECMIALGSRMRSKIRIDNLKIRWRNETIFGIIFNFPILNAILSLLHNPQCHDVLKS